MTLLPELDLALLEGVRRDDYLDALIFRVGEDVISSLVPTLWHARMRPDIAAGMVRPGFVSRCIRAYIAFSVSKL
ncbi:MAG: hypothetical protein UDC04_08405 [Collinsella bouchesdurhonensis]|nr:hypothetical protein [Collinsella bouchesdurhonensis]